MNRRLLLIAFASLGLTACSTDMIAPTKTPPAATSLQGVSGSGNDGDFLVLTSGPVDASFEGEVNSLGGKIKRRHDGAGLTAVSGLTEATAAQLATFPGVVEVSRDVQISLNLPVAPIEADVAALGGLTADSQTNPAGAILYAWQWNMSLIKANEAWAAGKLGSPSVTVAILDTGIDYDAPDLNGLVDLSRSRSFMSTYVPATPTSPVRLADDTVSRYYFASRNPISDYNGHGTNVATQVSSKAFAFAGVTSRTTLIGVKVLGSNGVGSLGTVLSGVLWAADQGADVANMSLGGGFPRAGNQSIIRIINGVFDYAKKKRMMVVVSAGNAAQDLDNNGDTYSTYCDAPHVLCVSAVGPKLVTGAPDDPAFYTNFGRRSIDVAAPGGNADAANGFPRSAWPWGADIASWVWSFCSKTVIGWTSANVPQLTSCAAGNRLSGYIGTSQAAPHAAGLAALVISVSGASKSMEVKRRITETADDLGPRGRDAYYGFGLINVANAVRNRHGDDDERDWRRNDHR